MDAPKPNSLRFRRFVRVGLAVVAIAMIAVAGWWMAGRKVWTDGQTGADPIRVFTADEDPRQVLWTPSRPVLPAGFTATSTAGADAHLYEPAISPDGTELFFVRGKAGLPVGEVKDGQPVTTGADVYVSRRKNTRWLDPVRLDAVSSRYDDLGPRMTADGRFLLFYSNRPGGQGGYDLWAAARSDEGDFGPPFNLGSGVNSEFDEYGPAPTADGKRLYFSTNRTAAGKEQYTAWRATIRAATTSDFDLWLADLEELTAAAALPLPPVLRVGVPAEDDPFASPKAPTTRPEAIASNLVDDGTRPPRRTLRGASAREVGGINTPFHEGAPCISPAGDFLYFASNRPGGHGKFDLYRSRLREGSPTEVENLGPSVNSAENETDPQLAHGGFKLYYSSDRLAAAAHGRVPAGVETAAARETPAEAPGIQPNAPTSPAAGLPDAPATRIEVADSHGRGYDLYEADSREVYPERQGRALPVIGWKLLAMIAGALLLLPLLLFLVKHVNRRNLTLLQRCFLAALCVYALFLFWTTSKHVVMEAYPQLAKDLGFIEVRINLDPKIEESNVAMAIRQQSSNDLPIAAAPAGQLAQQVIGGEVIAAAPDVAVNVPQAAVGAEAMTVVVAPPKIDVPKAAAPAVSMVSPVVAPTPQAVDINIDVGPRLQQAEAAPMIQAPQAPAAAQSAVAPQPIRPAAVAMPDLPAAQPQISVGSLAQDIGPVAPSVPQVDPGKVAVATAAPTQGATPTIDVPAPASARATAIEPAAAKIDASLAPAVRVAPALPAPTPAAAAMQPALPRAASSADAVSLTDAAAPSATPLPIPSPASGTVQIKPSQSPMASSSAGVATNVPTPTAAKMTGADPSLPSAGGTAAAAVERLIGPGSTDAAAAANVKTNVPAAGANTGGAAESLAAAPGVGAKIAADATKGLVGVAPNLPAGDLVRNPEVAGPKMDTTPVAGGDPKAPVAGAAQAVGLSRQDTPTGDLAGGAGIKESQLPRLPKAGGGTPSLAGSMAPAAAANALAGMSGPKAPVAPDPASASVATSAGVGGVTVRAPTTRPAAVEPSLADAVGGSSAGLKPTTRPTIPPVADAGSKAAPAASIAPGAAPTADIGRSTLASAPTALPAGAAVATADVRVTGPTVGNPAGAAAMVASNIQLATPRPAFSPIAAVAPDVIAAPTAAPTALRVEPSLTQTLPSGAGVAGLATAAPATPDVKGKTGGSIASATVVAPRALVATPALPAPSVAGSGIGQAIAGIEGPQMDLPRINAMPAAGSGLGTPGGVGAVAGGGPDGGKIAATRAQGSGPAVDRPILLASAGVPGVGPRIGQGGVGGPAAVVGPRPGIGLSPGLDISPNISVAAPKLGAPEALFQRSAEQRRPMIEKLGGTKESENAVERGLAWLARMQDPDGRWTYVGEGSKKSRNKANSQHDMALTGLSVLAFLAADHSPAKEGPYQRVVASGVDWLVSQQTDDGDLRGAKELRGAGSGKANMYDHGIATMAVAEAALMTGDRRYMDAAFKAAQFICDTQNKKTGGWRYVPGESGDTSVFGWQILALHNAELLGFQTPPDVRDKAIRFLSLVSSGKSRILAAYTPGEGPTPAMTAEALFCRILLGQPITDEQARDVVEFLGRDMPKAGNRDLYYWYYMSLSMSQLQANPQVRDAWDRWNVRCRDTLIATQARGVADVDGSWTDSRWGQHGGKVFSTALATLTLEVYYRYLPLEPGDPNAAKEAWKAAEPEKKTVKPKGPVGPKFEAN
ncbi:PD40 domain-containing protein [Humisphaera borealis]|uniref:PD40 domain-containing protein n=1 Tax=Humisphaera borealis TaxID=2807512 RepID=A0A7M2WSE7_9BACT|nr:PD40 domain-containing protein [Humisphaera borealis]QOV88339.1 PD40 domain-containing protein [Humisphaera borealis]